MDSALLLQTILVAAPLILAAMGGYTSERGGVINIGLEGMMLMGACTAALASVPAGPLAGIAAGIGGATALSLLHWLATQHYRIDHVISGMAINLFSAGATSFLFLQLADPDRVGQLPHFSPWIFVLLAVLSPALLFLYSRYSRGGLRLQAVGSDPDKARLVGVRPVNVRFFGLLATGLFTGLAGVLMISDNGVFTENMTAGNGYIALAALILGGWRPLPTLAACVAFGFFIALQIELQGKEILGITLPSELWKALPYIVTVIALAGFLGRSRTPAGLGKF